MKLTVDFETRSRVDIKKRGAHVYAENESTDVMCLAVKCDSGAPYLWVPEKFEHLVEWDEHRLTHPQLGRLMREADTIEAHNASFEIAIWHNYNILVAQT